jgi:hypothetical protein
MAKSASGRPKWLLPGSVLNALWGSVMPKLAATVWKGELHWPPTQAPAVPINGKRLIGHRLEGTAREEFWEALCKIAFSTTKTYRGLRSELAKGTLQNGARVSAGQRAAHVVLEYFDPKSPNGKCVPVRIIRTSAYDFVLSSAGLDVFIPENPFKDGDQQGQIKVLQMYRFRECGTPPIALPGTPSTFGKDVSEVLIPIPRLSTPTGSYQIHEEWAKGQANKVDWWLAGSSYRSMMAALPKVIATKWYDVLVQKTYGATAAAGFGPTGALFGVDLRQLLQERMETPLPTDMDITVFGQGQGPWQGDPLWRDHDVMITDEGFYIPDPGDPPDAKQILTAIEKGTAGNPVFTDSDGDE